MTTLISFDVLAQNVHNDLDAFGGSTQSAIVGVLTVTTGYGVSLPGHEVRHPLRVGWLGIREDIARYAESKRAELAVPGRYLGAWLDDGILYLDVTEVHAEFATAVRLGIERNQLAIYSFATGNSIYLTRPYLNAPSSSEQFLADAIRREIALSRPVFEVTGGAIAELGDDGELRLVEQ